MSKSYDPPRTIIGVDFSGAKNAGRKIWVTEGSIEGEGDDMELVVESCRSLFERCNEISKCEESMDALVQLITDAEDAAFGFDFPFGVPDEALTGIRGWRDAVEKIAEIDGADAFYETCRNNTGDSYVLRETDARHAALCPYSWLLYKQTYHGISGVLDAVSGETAILPIDDTTDSTTWLLEVYPAATLESLGLYRQGYKGRNGRKERLRENLEGLLDREDIRLSGNVDKAEIEKNSGGDALDSLVAAYAVFRNVSEVPTSEPNVGSRWRTEGHIYV